MPHELDKLISDNLDKTAIKQMLSDAGVALDDETGSLGTLKLLEAFLFSGGIKRENESQARVEIIGPLRELRKTRQEPAHSVVTNEHSSTFFDQRRRILSDIIFALGFHLDGAKEAPERSQIHAPDLVRS